MNLDQDDYWKKEENEVYGLVWRYAQDPPVKRNIKLIIKKTIKKEIKYIYNGEYLRKDVFKDSLQKPKILTNLEQIRYLKWQGNYGENKSKINKWKILWNGETLHDVGGLYSQDGKKQGIWKELFKNYWKKAQVYEIGEYKNDSRIGIWKYQIQNVDIGGGLYNDQGQKTLKWIELCDNFWNYGMITYHGEYKNNLKYGLWDSYWILGTQNYYIGGGVFTTDSNYKNGKWIEICDGFWKMYNQVTYKGEYVNGKKIGKWDIFYRDNLKNSFKKIAEGYYDKNNLKTGLWIVLSDGFYKGSNVTYIGDYNNDKKFGLWRIFYEQSYGNLKKIQIGGGSYDNQLNLKNGKWIELSDEFRGSSQVTYHGEYKCGKKVGLWDIFYINLIGNQYQLIGGGSYNQDQNNKNGIWNELMEGFDDWFQGICNGEYLNGKKIGQWNTFLREKVNQTFEKIGGGQYESQSNLKTGQWIDLSDNFNSDNQILYKGVYKGGMKVGIWDVYYKNYGNGWINIGGGAYKGKPNQKNGKWIDVIDQCSILNITINVGQYKDGKKLGKWQEKKRNLMLSQDFQLMQNINYLYSILLQRGKNLLIDDYLKYNEGILYYYRFQTLAIF